MVSEFYPVIGNWYKSPLENVFEVVAMDEDENYVEIQYQSGEIDGFDFETWRSMGIEAVPPPQDWTAAYGGIDIDDLGYSDIGGRYISGSYSVDDFD